ncbi:hypothetical protein GA549_00505 [Bifidobacterium adolescentis]|nr:hypothetical protein GA549_00505 [Bifidobacterium adolescentis]
MWQRAYRDRRPEAARHVLLEQPGGRRCRYGRVRIQDGSFAKEFIDDQDAGAPKFKQLQEEYGNVRIETVGPKLRAMFSWNNGKDDDADMATFTGKIARG